MAAVRLLGVGWLKVLYLRAASRHQAAPPYQTAHAYAHTYTHLWSRFAHAVHQVIELLYLRAICHHALGAVREAVRDYDDCLSHVPRCEDGSWAYLTPTGGGGALSVPS